MLAGNATAPVAGSWDEFLLDCGGPAAGLLSLYVAFRVFGDINR
jgi:hypothetical protein